MIALLVWSQLAVAAYACNAVLEMLPGPALAGPAATLQLGGDTAVLLEGGRQMTTGMDPRQPTLCVAHCQFGQQGVSRIAVADVPEAAVNSLYTLSLPLQGDEQFGSMLRAQYPAPPTDPPHAILHCCLRD